MAAKRDRTASGKQSRTGGNGGWSSSISFINVSLNDAEKSACSKWIAGEPDCFELLDQLGTDGYKVSFGYDEKSSAHLVSVTNRGGQAEYVGHCFTMRARSSWEALLRALWVHTALCEGDWSQIAQPNVDADIW